MKTPVLIEQGHDRVGNEGLKQACSALRAARIHAAQHAAQSVQKLMFAERAVCRAGCTLFSAGGYSFPWRVGESNRLPFLAGIPFCALRAANQRNSFQPALRFEIG